VIAPVVSVITRVAYFVVAAVVSAAAPFAVKVFRPNDWEVADDETLRL
jgi:hypothetical protein